MERADLSRNRIVDIASGIAPYDHPLIDFLTSHRQILNYTTVACSKMEDRSAIRRNIVRESGVLADDIEGIGGFSLEPLDLVAVWREASQYQFHRYELARMILTAHATQSLGDNWKGITKHYLETRRLAKKIVSDKPGQNTALRILREVRGSLDLLDATIYGSFGNEKVKRLSKSASKGDDTADQELTRLLDAQNKNSIPLVQNMEEALHVVLPNIEAAFDRVDRRKPILVLSTDTQWIDELRAETSGRYHLIIPTGLSLDNLDTQREANWKLVLMDSQKATVDQEAPLQALDEWFKEPNDASVVVLSSNPSPTEASDALRIVGNRMAINYATMPHRQRIVRVIEDSLKKAKQSSK
jgi:hypothetical protein